MSWCLEQTEEECYNREIAYRLLWRPISTGRRKPLDHQGAIDTQKLHLVALHLGRRHL